MASLKVSNILELNEKEREILDEMKRIINEECERLEFDIDEI